MPSAACPPLSHRRRRRLLAVTVAVTLVALLLSPELCLAQAPAPTTSAPPPTDTPTPSPTPTETPKPTTDTPKPTTEAPTETPTPTPKPAHHGSKSTSGSVDVDKSGKASKSGSRHDSDSDSGSRTASPRPTAPPRTTTPTTRPVATSYAPLTPTPTSTRDNTDAASNNQSRREGNGNKSIVIIVIAGIAGVCALGLIVMCFLRRSREDLDDLASPLPRFHQPAFLNQGHGGGPGSTGSFGREDTVSTSRSSLPTGPGAANFYKDHKLSISTTQGVSLDQNSLGITSPDMPANYRPSNRQSRVTSSRRSSRGGTFNLGTSAPPPPSSSLGPSEYRMSGESEMSNFSIRGSEFSSVDIDRPTYDSRLSSSTSISNIYRFSEVSEASVLRDDSMASFTQGHDRTVSVDVDAERPMSHSIGGNDPSNWYNSVDSPSSADRYTKTSELSSRASGNDRQSFEL